MPMKNALLFSIFVFLTINGWGQYKSIFGKSSTTWNSILFGACDAVTTSPITVIGDSTFRGHNYKIVNQFSIFDTSHGFLREDTLTGKVWFYNKTISKEFLVADLSLNKTDSFKIFTPNLDSSFIFVDTIYFDNGKKHIRFSNSYIQICAPEEVFEFIEGTGTNAGLFYNTEWNGNFINSYLLCHEKDGEKVYGNNLFNDSCFIQSLDVNDVQIFNELEVFPNPSSDYVTFRIKDNINGKYELKIYNSNAQLTHSVSTQNNEIKISFNDKSTCINYFILMSNSKILKTGKILHQ